MAAYNAAVKGDLQRAVSLATRDLVRFTAEQTGANSDAVKEAASRLRKNWRALVNRKSNRPSPPGQPPARRTGALARSIGSAVVDGVRRVGSGLHTARLLQTGVNTTAKGPRMGQRRGKAYRLVIPARPHGTIALEQSIDEMNNVTVSTLQVKVAKRFGV